jgi:hypothetical protein
MLSNFVTNISRKPRFYEANNFPGYIEASLIRNTVENSLKVYTDFILNSDCSVMPERLEDSAMEIDFFKFLFFCLFWFVFCLFRFNRNTEIRCFDIESKQPKQTSCFGKCRN